MKKFKIGVGLALLAVLAGCGGGGSSVTSADVEVTGVAAKGLVKYGLVKAYAVTSGVVSTTAIDSAETNIRGEYKLTKIPGDSLIKLEVIPIQGKTKVVDETDGSEYEPTTDFKLSAVLSIVPGAANEGHITPATEMVVRRAEALSGGMTASNASFAAGEIQNSLGFSPNEKPVFLDDGVTPSSKAAVYLKTVALVAKDTVTASSLGCTDTTNAARVTCITKAMGTKAALGGTNFSSVVSALSVKQDIAKVGVSESVKSEVSAPVAIKAPSEVTVPSNLPTTAIAKAKQFYQTLKNSLKLLSSDDPIDTTFETELNKIATEIKDTTVPANDYALSAADFMLTAAGIFKDFKDGKTNFTSFPDISNNGIKNSCSWTKDLNSWKSVTIASDKNDANILSCRLGEIIENTQFKTPLVDGAGNYPIRYWSGIRLFVTQDPTDAKALNIYSYHSEILEYYESTTSSFKLLRKDGKTFLNKSTPSTLLENYPESFAFEKMNKAVLTFTKQEENSIAAEIKGFIATAVNRKKSYANPANYNNRFNDWVNANNFASETLGIKHGLNLKIEATKQNNVGVLNFSGYHSLYKTEDVVHSKISLDTGSQITGKTDSNNNLIPTGFDLGITIETEKTSLTGKLIAKKFAKGPEANSKDEPTNVTLDVALKINQTDELFKGTITFENATKATFNPTQPISTANFEQQSIEVEGNFKVPNKDSIQLKIKAENAIFKKPTLSFSYTQKGSPLITIKAYGDELDPSKDYMVLTFGADVTTTIKKGDESFDLKSNGATIATYKKSTGAIEYLDGSYEKF